MVMAEENSSCGSGSRRSGSRSRKHGSRRRRRGTRNLPEELQDEILRRLPVKSLTRFESVCKTWWSKFYSRPFIDLYGRRRHPGGAISYNNNALEIHTIQMENLLKMVPGLRLKIDPLLLQHMINTNPEEWRTSYRVLGPTSNGIYCLTSLPSNKSRDRFCVFAGKIALCNPATHNYKFTNPFPLRIRSLLDNIASKPSRLHFGFGRISSSMDYKVVVIVHYGKPFSSFVSLVYSLQRGEWKKIGPRKAKEAFNSIGRRIIKIHHPFELCCQRFLEGCWHWAAIGEDESSYVLSFNFADETFKLIGAPSRYPEETVPSRGSVFVLHDHLAFIYLSHTMLLLQRVEVEADVWMMMEYGVEKSWSRIYKINPNFSGTFWRFVGMDCTPVGGDEESSVVRVERLFFEDYDEHQIISCDDVGHQVLRRDLCEESGLWNNTTNSTNYFWNTPGISTYAETLERL